MIEERTRNEFVNLSNADIEQYSALPDAERRMFAEEIEKKVRVDCFNPKTYARSCCNPKEVAVYFPTEFLFRCLDVKEERDAEEIAKRLESDAPRASRSTDADMGIRPQSSISDFEIASSEKFVDLKHYRAIVNPSKWDDLDELLSRIGVRSLPGGPQFAEKCDSRKLRPSDWRRLIEHQPQVLEKCDWEGMTASEWDRLNERFPEVAEKSDWSKASEDERTAFQDVTLKTFKKFGSIRNKCLRLASCDGDDMVSLFAELVVFYATITVAEKAVLVVEMIEKGVRLACIDLTTGARTSCPPDKVDVYFPTDLIRRYFSGMSSVNLADLDRYHSVLNQSMWQDLEDLMLRLNVRSMPSVKSHILPPEKGERLFGLFKRAGLEAYYYYKGHEEFTVRDIVGAQELLARILSETNPKVKKGLSIALWDIIKYCEDGFSRRRIGISLRGWKPLTEEVLGHRIDRYVGADGSRGINCLSGIHTVHPFRPISRCEGFDSPLLLNLRSAKWIAIKDTEYAAPKGLSVECLPCEYRHSSSYDPVVQMLGIEFDGDLREKVLIEFLSHALAGRFVAPDDPEIMKDEKARSLIKDAVKYVKNVEGNRECEERTLARKRLEHELQRLLRRA